MSEELTDRQREALTRAIATRRSDADVDRAVERIVAEVREQERERVLDEVERVICAEVRRWPYWLPRDESEHMLDVSVDEAVAGVVDAICALRPEQMFNDEGEG